MQRTPIVLMTAAALLLVACQKTEEDSETSGSALTDIPVGIYDGERAVLKVTDEGGGKRLYSFAHTFEKNAPGAPVSLEIIKGMVETKAGEVPKLVADEVYPCSATLSFDGADVVATGRCRGRSRDFRVKLAPRDYDKLAGTFGPVEIRGGNANRLDVSISGFAAPTDGEWIYGGGAYRAKYGDCLVSVVVRSPTKDLLLDVGSTNRAIDLVARGQDCEALSSGRLSAR